MKKKILIDSVSLLSPLTGIGRYTNEILHQIKKRDLYTLSFFYGYHSRYLIDLSKHSSAKMLKAILSKSQVFKKITRKIVAINSRLFQPSYDLYWQPNFIPNSAINTKKIVTTVHDFSFVMYPEFHPKERIDYFEKNFLKNIIRSDTIITGSNFTKQEIVSRLNFSKDKVKVIYHGINHNIFKIHKDTKLDFELPKKYILSVGSIEPRKNFLGLLKAYNLLDDKLKKEYKLVIVGFQGWENQEFMQQIKTYKEAVIYLGYISDEELAIVYNKASCFVFTSFYEGFGLPILEAMACGTPVVTSNTASMPEVGGDAVVYCNPNNPIDIKEKLHLVLCNQVLRTKIIQKGLKRVKLFSWEKAAQEHIKVFEELLSEA